MKFVEGTYLPPSWLDIPQINDSWTHPKYGTIKYSRDLGLYKVGKNRFYAFYDAIRFLTKKVV